MTAPVLATSYLTSVKPEWRRRRRILVLAAATVGLAAAATITAAHLDHQYGPVSSGHFGGPYTDRNIVFSSSSSFNKISTTRGATALLLMSLDNSGPHSVKVTSIETDAVTTKIRWSVWRVVPGGFTDGINTPWRDFPATIPAHDSIRLLVTVRRPPTCQSRPMLPRDSNAAVFYRSSHWVRWQSLLHDHRTMVDDNFGGDYLQVC